MCEQCRDRDDDMRWFAMLIRQAFLMVVKGIERKYHVGEPEKSIRRDTAA